MQQRDPGREWNPGPLQNLGTWDAARPTELNGPISEIIMVDVIVLHSVN